jgi:tetratricopeptide (TPR) repeat protein
MDLRGAEDRMARILIGKRRIQLAAAGIAMAGGLLVGSASAQLVSLDAAPLARAYGAGVHAYFAGDYQRAYDELTQAIEAGTEDPRAWYFRGLTAAKLGRLDEVEADFATAANRETDAAADWNVSRSLERVQGCDRLALERHRVRARVANLQRRAEATERRYRYDERLQPEVLRRVRPAAPAPDPLGLFTEEVNPGPVVEEVEAPEDTPSDDDERARPKAADVPDDEPEMTIEEPVAEEPPVEEPPPAEATGAEVFGN